MAVYYQLMPKRSNDFQKLIAFLEEQLAPVGATVRESVMLSPLDCGDEVEIDVVIEAPLGHHSLRVAVECRDHARPATVQWINELAGRYVVLPVDRVVAVSRSGFSAGARHRARGTKVNLFTLKEAQEADWPGTYHGWRMAFVEIAPKPHGVQVKYRGESPGLNGVDLLNAPVADAFGKIISTVGADAKALYLRHARQRLAEWWPTEAGTILRSEGEQSRIIHLSFKAHDRSVVAPDGRRYPMDGLIIKVACAAAGIDSTAADEPFFRGVEPGA